MQHQQKERTLLTNNQLQGAEKCTRPACLKVLDKIADLQYNNEAEREEIEEEYENLADMLLEVEAEVQRGDIKLAAVMEVTNQLEETYEQLVTKVEEMDKHREAMLSERSEMNNKIMILEIEKRKISRGLVLAKKALADAMWRKKKEQVAQNQEAGLSLAASSISEQSIIHADDKVPVFCESLCGTALCYAMLRGVVWCGAMRCDVVW